MAIPVFEDPEECPQVEYTQGSSQVVIVVKREEDFDIMALHAVRSLKLIDGASSVSITKHYDILWKEDLGIFQFENADYAHQFFNSLQENN